MNYGRRVVAALVFTLLVVSAPVATVSAQGEAVDWSDDQAPEIYKHEDVLTVGVHDRAEFSSPLNYWKDDGSMGTLPAHLNSTQDTPVGVRLDKIEADRYQLFPRISGEEENSATWLNASNWTTSSGAGSSMTVADADGVTASGVPAVSMTASVASSETATANFSEDVSITTDPDKRVLLWVGEIESASAGATIELRAVDDDGDYRSYEINNTTRGGIVVQERLNDLSLTSNGDGTMGEIDHVKLVVSENDATVNTVGLDLDSKTIADLGETMIENSDGDEEATTVDNFTDGGEINLTSLETMGGMYDSAEIHDLKVYNVRYGISDMNTSEYRAEFGNASDYGSYDHDLTLEAPLRVPTAIDLSHGTLTMRMDQQFVSERYAVLEVAEDVDKNDEADDVNSTHYSDKKSALGTKGDTQTILSSGVTAGSTDWIQVTILLLDGEYDALAKDESAAVGPVGDSSGGFFSGIINFVTQPLSVFVGSILAMLGLGAKASSG